jgi:hypothetical protein
MRDWIETKARLKQKLSMLADNKTLLSNAKQNDLLNRLETKLGKPREALCKLISEL